MSEHGGTRVTCQDLGSDDSDSVVIKDDYVLITDGRCYLDGIQTHKNGTVVLTVKKSTSFLKRPDMSAKES